MLKVFFKERVQNLRLKLVITIVLLAYVAVRVILDMPCPILHFIGIPCPGCGMTRALLSVLKLELASAFDFHYMFWSLPLLYLFFLCDGRLFKNKYVNMAVLTAMGVGFVCNWIRHFI